MPGLVPYVIIGSMAAASNFSSRSNTAPSSDGSCRHAATAASHAAPVGARGRPFR